MLNGESVCIPYLLKANYVDNPNCQLCLVNAPDYTTPQGKFHCPDSQQSPPSPPPQADRP